MIVGVFKILWSRINNILYIISLNFIGSNITTVKAKMKHIADIVVMIATALRIGWNAGLIYLICKALRKVYEVQWPFI
jgi:hypothetical protein